MAAIRTNKKVNRKGFTYRISLLKSDTSRIEPDTFELIQQIYALDNILFRDINHVLEQNILLSIDLCFVELI